MTTTQDLHVVFGARSAVGTAVIHELRTLGRHVRAISRQPWPTIEPGIELLIGEVTDEHFTHQACRGAAVVYHCINPRSTTWEALFPLLFERIMHGAAAAGAKLIVADDASAYGKVQGRIIEDLAYRPTSHKGTIRAQLATTLMRAHRDGTIWAAIGRAAEIYGPGVIHSVAGENLFRRILDGKRGMWFGSLDAPHSLTFVTDFARGLVTLGEHEDAPGHIWHIPGAPAITGRQFLSLIFDEIGTRPRIDTYNRPMLTILGFISSHIHDIVETLYQFEAPFVLDTSKYQRTFGSGPVTPHAEAIRQTIAWFRATPPCQ